MPADLQNELSSIASKIARNNRVLDTLTSLRKKLEEGEEGFDFENEEVFDCEAPFEDEEKDEQEGDDKDSADAAQKERAAHKLRRREYLKAIQGVRDRLEDAQDELDEA